MLGFLGSAGEFIWYSDMDLISVKEFMENKFQAEAENIVFLIQKESLLIQNFWDKPIGPF